jgi:hypothetical protein
MKRTLKMVLPVLLPLLGVAGVVVLVKLRPAAKPAPPEPVVPLVRVVSVAPTNHQFVVLSQGNVTPHTDIQLTAEVAGRVIAVAPSFREGGFFAAGEVLVRVDPRDYELAATRAAAQLAEARVRLEREEAEAAVALAEWRELGGDRPANPLLRSRRPNSIWNGANSAPPSRAGSGRSAWTRANTFARATRWVGFTPPITPRCACRCRWRTSRFSICRWPVLQPRVRAWR